MSKLTIGKLAIEAGVGVETVRFYQRKELLRVPGSIGSVRSYTEDDIQRIVFIKKAQQLGFSLSEVKDLLELNTKARQTCRMVKKKTLEKIGEIDQKMEALLKMKEMLQKLSCVCDSNLDQVRQYKVQECFSLAQDFSCEVICDE